MMLAHSFLARILRNSKKNRTFATEIGPEGLLCTEKRINIEYK